MAELVQNAARSSTIKPLTTQFRVRDGVGAYTLTEDATLSARSPNYLRINGNAASRNVDLPAEGTANGLPFWIYNSGSAGRNLVIRNAAAATILTLNSGESGVVSCDGTTWHVIGLASVDLSSIAVDTISESTAGAGVTVDGVLLKDGDVVLLDSDRLVAGTGSDYVVTHNGTNTLLTNTTGNVVHDNQAATGATYVDLGTDTSATEFAVRNNGGAALLKIDGAGTITQPDGTILHRTGKGTGAGDVIERIGATATEGMELCVSDVIVSPAAVESAVCTVPARSVILSVQANCQTVLTGGGTTVTWSLGTAATPDKYGTAGDGVGDTLAANGKVNVFPAWALLTSAEDIKLTGCATGGAADGDTALTVGSVRVVTRYYTLNALDDV